MSCTNPSMSLKNAAFLALVGMILLTILLVVGLINDTMGVMQGIVPAVKLVTSLIDAFAGVTLVAFLYVFHRHQS
jgi:hypothetical protein